MTNPVFIIIYVHVYSWWGGGYYHQKFLRAVSRLSQTVLYNETPLMSAGVPQQRKLGIGCRPAQDASTYG